MLLPLLLCLLPSGCTSRASISKRCSHLHFWNKAVQACVPCATGFSHVPLRGRQFTVNCGMMDTGGRFASPSEPCPTGSFNNGTFQLCQACFTCPAGVQFHRCTPENDTQCCLPGQLLGATGSCKARCCAPPKQCPPMDIDTHKCSSPMQVGGGSQATASSAPPPTSQSEAAPQASTRLLTPEASVAPGQALGSAPATTQLQRPEGHQSPSNWAGYSSWLPVLVLLLLLAAITLSVWTHQAHCRHQGSSPMAKPHLPLLSAEETAGTAPAAGSAGRYGVHQPCLAAPGAQFSAPAPSGLWGAPLQRLLDDADVLEELIMLLDPEGKARGCTRHLASRYGLSATWIDYAYSLRSTRSPLRAMLETVAARQPEATLGQLAGLLATIGRKDAMQVLERVRCPPGPSAIPSGPQVTVHPAICAPAAHPQHKHGPGLEDSRQL